MVRFVHRELLREGRYLPSRKRRLNDVLGSQKGVIDMITRGHTTELALCHGDDLRRQTTDRETLIGACNSPQ